MGTHTHINPPGLNSRCRIRQADKRVGDSLCMCVRVHVCERASVCIWGKCARACRQTGLHCDGGGTQIKKCSLYKKYAGGLRQCFIWMERADTQVQTREKKEWGRETGRERGGELVGEGWWGWLHEGVGKLCVKENKREIKKRGLA